jgi:hypothetical protein
MTVGNIQTGPQAESFLQAGKINHYITYHHIPTIYHMFTTIAIPYQRYNQHISLLAFYMVMIDEPITNMLVYVYVFGK